MSLYKHLQECADEAGEELFDTLTHPRTLEYKGRTIEVYYNENRCRWFAWTQGIGESTGGIYGDDDRAIAEAKAKIDRQ